MARIEALEREEYLAPAFITGKDPGHTLVHSRRIDGVGGLEAYVDVKGGVIKSVRLAGGVSSPGAGGGPPG